MGKMKVNDTLVHLFLLRKRKGAQKHTMGNFDVDWFYIRNCLSVFDVGQYLIH
jgi:hypothetical protein